MVRIINSDSKIEPETQNNKRLIEFYEELSDRGDSQAQNIIGEIYLKGKGDHLQNFNKAFDYFALAASEGHLTAKVNLAKMYSKGLGVEQNYARAFELFVEASNSGDPNARYELGMMFLITPMPFKYIIPSSYLAFGSPESDASVNSLKALS
eukprot:Anaeramoba_flamelloidesc42641_g2_i2.p1 GENE.c42641_g2_i2~~c42641_g2_i2.p1  ORF type:complete len:152 (-),score=34.00 c42641_g2_i2:64-519(-)